MNDKAAVMSSCGEGWSGGDGVDLVGANKRSLSKRLLNCLFNIIVLNSGPVGLSHAGRI